MGRRASRTGRTTRRLVGAAVAAAVGAGAVGSGLGAPAAAARSPATPAIPAAAATPQDADPTGPLPPVPPGTSFVDHEAKLAGMDGPDWYEANIPFVDLPDREIEDTYYYRWRTFREALKDTGPDDGWIVTEFLGPVGYSAPGGAISAAAAHHIREGRWLRDTRYLDDYVDYWLSGSGAGAKPATEGLNPNSTDWAHQYSMWIADSVLARAEIDGRVDEATRLLPDLEEQWQGWAPQYDADLGLYWQTPVWDAMEFTASSYQSDDPYHGGEGFRPTINAYQYGDAEAIAAIARLAHDRRTAARYARRADALQEAQESVLWDPADGFYKHVMRDDNPDRTPIADREEIGFVPWYFGMAPDDAEHAAAWAQLLDPQGFAAPFGPTTVERRSDWFMHDALAGCCRWDGPSWPYATSQTLTAMGTLLADYRHQDAITSQDLVDAVRTYAVTQRKDGRPYVAEAHHPDEDRWIYDGRGHSEDYNHSTFADVVLGSLLGIHGRTDDAVRLDPQVGDWDHFAVENVPYHGHDLTVVWDENGSHYAAGSGFSVWLDGAEIHRQPALGDVTLKLPGRPATAPELTTGVDDAVNVAGTGFPRASASYTWQGDRPARATDGQDFQLDVPNTRWTTYGTPHESDRLQVDFGVGTPVQDVRTTFYDDGGGVQVPTSFDVEYRTGDGSWASLPGQHRSPEQPVGGGQVRITLDAPVRTDAIRLVGSRGGAGWGVTSLESWHAVDPAVTATVRTGADGTVSVSPGVPVTVTTTARPTGRPAKVTGDALLAPTGWTVEPLDAPLPGTLARPVTRTWRVTPPDDLDLSTDHPLRYLVTPGVGRPGYAGDVATARWSFDPVRFGETVWDDDFSTDRLGEYTVSGSLGEPAPDLSVDTAAGVLRATASGRARGHVRIPGTAGRRVAVVVEPTSFVDGQQVEDSLFLGTSGSPFDLAMSWYNNDRGESGVNVVTGGRGRPEAEGPSAAVRWQPGDRFATVVADGTLTSWVEHEGAWRRITAAPVSAAVPTDVLATWTAAFALRMDAGTLALDRVTVLRK